MQVDTEFKIPDEFIYTSQNRLTIFICFKFYFFFVCFGLFLGGHGKCCGDLACDGHPRIIHNLT